MSAKKEDTTHPPSKTRCGIIMPIAAIDGCSAAHWQDVLTIIREGLQGSLFEAELVSSSNDTAIIHKNIVKNLYENEIVICDVSGRNPNVMFELGMRLAFNKPVVVIKDNVTPYSFDTSPIEHLEYPRDLRFLTIKDFQEKLRAKVTATHLKSKEPNYSFFLSEYTIYESSHLPKEDAGPYQVLLKELGDLKREISAPRNTPILRDESNGVPKWLLWSVDSTPDQYQKLMDACREEGRPFAMILDDDLSIKDVRIALSTNENVFDLRKRLAKRAYAAHDLPF